MNRPGRQRGRSAVMARQGLALRCGGMCAAVEGGSPCPCISRTPTSFHIPTRCPARYARAIRSQTQPLQSLVQTPERAALTRQRRWLPQMLSSHLQAVAIGPISCAAVDRTAAIHRATSAPTPASASVPPSSRRDGRCTATCRWGARQHPGAVPGPVWGRCMWWMSSQGTVGPAGRQRARQSVCQSVRPHWARLGAGRVRVGEVAWYGVSCRVPLPGLPR